MSASPPPSSSAPPDTTTPPPSGSERRVYDAAVLERLAAQVERELSLTSYPRANWVPPHAAAGSDPSSVLDCLIVGGGHCGMSASFFLRRDCVHRVLVLEREAEDKAGPWNSFARMETLRTPKKISGIEYGIPSLTFEHWYIATHGQTAWDEMVFPPTQDWADYLVWFRKVLNLPVKFNQTVQNVEWNADERLWHVTSEVKEGEDGPVSSVTYRARTVVWAAGMGGSGRWIIPPLVADNVPPSLRAHSSERVDFGALTGKRVVVLGAGASAFDNAACALEAGAGSVTLLSRRTQLPPINPHRWMDFGGFLKHYADMPDSYKIKFYTQILDFGQQPPQHTYDRCAEHKQFQVRQLALDDIKTDTQSGVISFKGKSTAPATLGEVITFDADYLIVACGFDVDLRLRPELAKWSHRIKTWGDVYAGEQLDARLRPYAYVANDFHLEDLEAKSGEESFMHSFFNYSYSFLSQGQTGATINGSKYGVARLIAGVTKYLYLKDVDYHLQTLYDYDDVELDVTKAPNYNSNKAAVTPVE